MLILSEHLALSAIEPSDSLRLMDILTAPSVAQWLIGLPAKAEAMGFDAWLDAVVHRKNDFYFTVRERRCNEAVGLCAYQDIDCRNGRVILWAALSPEYEDGAELLRLLTLYAFGQLRLEHTALLLMSGDSRTMAFAEEAGFTRDAVLQSRVKKNGKRHDCLLYSLLKEEVSGT